MIQIEEEIKLLPDFKLSLETARSKKEDETCMKTANLIRSIVKECLIATKEVQPQAQTTQVIKPRPAPTWKQPPPKLSPKWFLSLPSKVLARLDLPTPVAPKITIRGFAKLSSDLTTPRREKLTNKY